MIRCLSMLERTLQRLINYYTANISFLWDELRLFFDGIYENILIQFKKREIKYVFQREIFMVNFWWNIWSEYNWVRPCLVVSNWKINKWSLVIVIPMSSASWKEMFLWDVRITSTRENGLRRESIIRTSHAKSISKRRLIKKIWICDIQSFSVVLLELQWFFN